MEMEVDEVQSSTDFNPKALHYLFTIPGWLRIANLVLGVISIILASIGFGDDFPSDGDWEPFLYFYGLGYNQERANLWNLIIVCVCFIISALFLLSILCTEGAVNKWRARNRFINLSLAFFLLLGWFCGFLGLILFRQGCCRVEAFSNVRIPHEFEGYMQPCLCFMNPHVDPERTYPVLKYNDAEPDLRFESIKPHHFNVHVINLVIILINVGVYFAAVFKVK